MWRLATDCFGPRTHRVNDHVGAGVPSSSAPESGSWSAGLAETAEVAGRAEGVDSGAGVATPDFTDAASPEAAFPDCRSIANDRLMNSPAMLHERSVLENPFIAGDTIRYTDVGPMEYT